MNTRDIVLGDRIFALSKGDPGTGKTVASGSFPNPYFIDTDGRIRSLVKMFPGKSIEYDTFSDFWQVCLKIEELNRKCDYETIVVSSLTSLANLAIEYSLKFRGAVGSEEASKKKDKGGLTRGNIPLTDVSDWGVEFRGLSRIVEGLKALPCHVILEAHVIAVERNNLQTGSSTVSRRLMTGAKGIAAYLPTMFDEAYHFYVESDAFSNKPPKFKVKTIHSGDDWAKTVLPLPPEIDWTNQNFYELLRKYIKEPYVAPKDEVQSFG